MQEANIMKKIIGLVLVFILVFAVAADSFAASKPKITKQPETATVKKGGKVSFSIKTSGTVNTVIWYFVDPVSGNAYTGKKLTGAVKGVKIVGPTNGKKITLSKVPESMHGWTVYAHVNGNGYKIDSDKVLLLISGMETPTAASAEAAPPVEEAPPAEDAPPADTQESTEEPAPAEPASEPAAEPAAEPAPAAEEAPAEESAGPITVSATSKSLRRLDASGDIIDEKTSSRLEFEGTGYILVTSDEPIISWTLNGIRIHPTEPVKEIRIMNITADLSIDITTARVTAAEVVVDESRMCRVVCSGCTFSYARGKLRSVSEGEVPAGAPINVVADSSDLAEQGYRINGGEPEYVGKAGFQFIVNEDVEISCK